MVGKRTLKLCAALFVFTSLESAVARKAAPAAFRQPPSDAVDHVDPCVPFLAFDASASRI